MFERGKQQVDYSTSITISVNTKVIDCVFDKFLTNQY